VYVDNDPITAYVGDGILADNPGAAMMRADLRDVDTVINTGPPGRLLDFGEPVAVLLVGTLPFLPDPIEQVADLLTGVWDALAPGSLLVFTHAVHDTGADEAASGALTALYENTPTPWRARRRGEVADLWARLRLPADGLVNLAECLPLFDDVDEPDPATKNAAVAVLTGVGRRW
jgi:hypothetical protein